MTADSSPQTFWTVRPVRRGPSEAVRVFEHDPDLLAGLDAAVAEKLRRRAIARRLELPCGAWSPPSGDGPLYHHIGLYAYRRKALQRFVGLQPSPLETRERLEQLRALEAGMRIDAVVVNDVPLGVDTPHDLEKAREIIAARRHP